MASESKISDSKEEELDIPSDFFDDFTNKEFMEGLSVIDSWDDEAPGRQKPPNTHADIDAVEDLRELIVKDKQDASDSKFGRKPSPVKYRSPNSRSGSDIDRFIQPGSRRDPNKTKEAIKKDKEEKVKEYLAKSLEMDADVKPPGTELDDYCEEKQKKPPPKVYRQEFTRKMDDRPRNDWNKPREHSSRDQPPNYRHQYNRSPRRSPRSKRFSPKQGSPKRYSPYRRSPRRHQYSRSPVRRRSRDRWSPGAQRRSKRSDDFLYPKGQGHKDVKQSYQHNAVAPSQEWLPPSNYIYPNPMPQNNPAYPVPNYPYGNYVNPPAIPGMELQGGYVMPQHGVAPQPVAAPGTVQLQAPVVPIAAPSMVPPPMHTAISTPVASSNQTETTSSKLTPYDALAQLVADGKLSQEDYLKLTPNKGVTGSTSKIDVNKKVQLISRCQDVVSKLNKLHLPNRLILLPNMTSHEPKSIPPKYSSPLKREHHVEFYFTKPNSVKVDQNKQLIESIISTIGFENAAEKSKLSRRSNMKDAAVQTSKPFCDICEIRDSTKFYDVATSVDRSYLTTTIHTQVVDQDLVSSKSVFAPNGGIADGAPVSIAHLTPAQLVSQLAAKAKTLKQDQTMDQPHPMRHNPSSSYDYRRGQGYQNNYGNYRY